MQKFLLFFALMLAYLEGYGQGDTDFVHLAKDNYQCVYGFKKGKEWVLRPQFAEAGEFYNGLSIVSLENGKSGVVDNFGKVRIAAKYDRISHLRWPSEHHYPSGEFVPENTNRKGFFGIYLNGKWGIADQDDKIILDPEYDGIIIADRAQMYIIRKNKLYGLADSTGLLLAPQFKFIDWFWGDIFAAISNSYQPGMDTIIQDYNLIYHSDLLKKTYCNFGLVDVKGKIIIPMQYDFIEKADEKHYWARKANKIGLYRTDGTIVIPVEYEIDSNEYNFDKVVRVKFNGKYGLLGTVEEKLTIPMKYSFLKVSSYRLGVKTVKPDGRIGVFNIAGKSVLPFKYDSLDFLDRSGVPRPENFYIIAKRNKKMGVFDAYGKLLIPFQYEKIFESAMFSGKNYFIVQKKNKFGICDSMGKIILPVEHDFVHVNQTYRDEFAVIKNNKLSLYCPMEASPCKDISKEYVISFDSSGHAIVEIDTLGECILKRDGSLILPPSRNVSLHDSFYSYLGNNGKLVMKNFIGEILGQAASFDIEWPSAKGYTYVRTKSHKVGVIDFKRNLVVDTLYDEIKIRNFDHDDEPGYWVCKYPENWMNIIEGEGNKEGARKEYPDTSWIFISNDGTKQSQKKFDYVSYFYNGVAIVSRAGLKGIINAKGEIVLPLVYDTIWRDSFSYYYFKKGKQTGLMNSQFKIIVSGMWNDYLGFSGGYVVFLVNGRVGIIDSIGRMLYNPEKNEIDEKLIHLEVYFQRFKHLLYIRDSILPNSMPWDSVIRGNDILLTNYNKELSRKLRNKLIVLALKGNPTYPWYLNFEKHYLEPFYTGYTLMGYQPIIHSSVFNSEVEYKTQMALAYLNQESAGLKIDFANNESTIDKYDRHIYNYEIRENELVPLKIKNLFDTSRDWINALNLLLLDKMKDWDDPYQSCVLDKSKLLASEEMFEITPEGLKFYFSYPTWHSFSSRFNCEKQYRQIVIPYAELKSIANLKSPLAEFMRN